MKKIWLFLQMLACVAVLIIGYFALSSLSEIEGDMVVGLVMVSVFMFACFIKSIELFGKIFLNHKSE